MIPNNIHITRRRLNLLRRARRTTARRISPVALRTSSLLMLRRNSPIPTLLATPLHDRTMQPTLDPPLRLLPLLRPSMRMLPALNVHHALVGSARRDLNDVPSVQKAGDEAEEAQGEVYQRVCAAETALYPDWGWGEYYCQDGEEDVAWGTHGRFVCGGGGVWMV